MTDSELSAFIGLLERALDLSHTDADLSELLEEAIELAFVVLSDAERVHHPCCP